MMPTAFRAVPTARRLGGSDGRMPGNPVQPRPYSSPGAPALLPARRASPSGGREARDKGVTYYSVDLGRVQRGGRDNDADRDVTVIPVIPGRRSHQGRCRGAGHHRVGHPRRARPGDGVGPGCRHARSPVPVAHGALLPLVGSLSSSRVTSSSCALPFLSVAGVSRGVRRHQFQLRTAVPSWLQGLFGRGRSHGFPLCCRSPSRAVCAAVTRSSCASRTPSGTAGRWAGRATRAPRRCG